MPNMSWFSALTTAFGSILLAHACYSAQEFSTFQSLRSSAGAASSPSDSLPIDITIETIAALLVISLGLVLGTNDLRPIHWHVWAGKIEREGEEGAKNAEGEVSKDFMGNPFSYLETRPSFVDVRRQRKEFEEWVRTGGESK
ncbi:hypothetical protein CMQ_6160 [Grosmannia clavigera kw1407]|uniref:Magnesium transporter n=1 Tax=Grosmannia clavigera (strain kw1407 / UAMH 11150) TaxID=655863 RepID=F0XMH1_GROCL|nr:uncharacterized protein CMQ_6160 [Grosmannia clavigera kw1407]EFX01218.1 hypothetical protein CMQ_6160 [Grosmannia clavigera kw1407]